VRLQSIEEAKLAFEYHSDAVEKKLKSLCDDIVKGWMHVQDHKAGIALLLKEVIELNDDLNEFKTHSKMEIECNCKATEEVDSSTSCSPGRFLPLLFIPFCESIKTKSFFFNR
jgi:hypothetical protein